MSEALLQSAYSRRTRWAALFSLLTHFVVLVGGFSLLYQDAQYSVGAGGGTLGAKLVSFEELSEISTWRPQPIKQNIGKDAFIIPNKKIAKPPVEKSGDSRVEGSAGSGEGLGAPTTLPSYFLNPKPPYPRDLRAKGIEGTVTLKVAVDKRGRVSAVTLVQSSGYKALDVSALNTVKKRWRFRPARLGSLKVASEVIVPFEFSLN